MSITPTRQTDVSNYCRPLCGACVMLCNTRPRAPGWPVGKSGVQTARETHKNLCHNLARLRGEPHRRAAEASRSVRATRVTLQHCCIASVVYAASAATTTVNSYTITRTYASEFRRPFNATRIGARLHRLIRIISQPNDIICI